jgi:hypothetical protein
MLCASCGQEYSGSVCPHCRGSMPMRISRQQGEQESSRVVEAEVVGEEQYHAHQQGNAQHGGRYFRYSSWNVGSAAQQQSCLPFFITFGLMLACGVQWGVLASIGFLFFYSLGSILGFFFSMGKILNGTVVNPWVVRCCNWVASSLLTQWLAS